MRRILVSLLALAVLALVIMPGCGKAQEVPEEGKSDISVEGTGEAGQGGKVTLSGDDGESTYEVGEEKVPSEEELGAPVYPGAEYVPGSGIPLKKSSAEGDVSIITAEFSAAVAAQKVINWYSGKLGNPSLIDESTGETAWVFKNEAGEVIDVTVKSQEGATRITIARVTGMKGQND